MEPVVAAYHDINCSLGELRGYVLDGELGATAVTSTLKNVSSVLSGHSF